MAIEKLSCPACGASVKLVTNKCDYCISTIIFSADNNSVSAKSGGNCPACGKTIYEGLDVCLHCATILHPSTKLENKIKKVHFSQEKLKKDLPLKAIKRAGYSLY